MRESESKSIYSEKVHAGSRTYFFDVKLGQNNTKYFCITETSNTSTSSSRHRIMVFQEHLEEFNTGYRRAIESLRESMPSYSVEQMRKAHPHAYKKWTPEEEAVLSEKFKDGADIQELAAFFQRKPGAIRSRLSKLRLSSFPGYEQAGVIQRANARRRC